MTNCFGRRQNMPAENKRSGRRRVRDAADMTEEGAQDAGADCLRAERETKGFSDARISPGAATRPASVTRNSASVRGGLCHEENSSLDLPHAFVPKR